MFQQSYQKLFVKSVLSVTLAYFSTVFYQKLFVKSVLPMLQHLSERETLD